MNHVCLSHSSHFFGTKAEGEKKNTYNDISVPLCVIGRSKRKNTMVVADWIRRDKGVTIKGFS